MGRERGVDGEREEWMGRERSRWEEGRSRWGERGVDGEREE